ncbi:phosphonoacetaldehyde hydrolase [Sphingobium sp. SYK-6]|uniref:phosphonoacetaldehyde hydrolase n=1 Tax=Sphingobium sp. (strain NBRC 103272 / SYK-6) TaxID=627192 RepID=UPI000227711C|nr:phosphonoacetaldehyde hydrolase [Sphingobium sp. SYK-6]BAK66379.1 phosphonoacetaldehyde hydrolase [Sphingobium sp. SYK-6]
MNEIASPLAYSGKITAAIFDWAGTVLDFGCIAPVAAFQEAFANARVPISEAEARGPMGAAKRTHIELILADKAVAGRWLAYHGKPSDEQDLDALYADFLRIDQVNCARYSALIPGALETIGALRERGIAIGSTTGYPRSIMDGLIPLAAAQGYEPDCCITVSDVTRGRPYPDMILANALALGLADVRGAIVVDDSPSGLTAGRAVGMWAIGILASGNEVGLSLEDWTALSADEQDAHRGRGLPVLARAGAHYVIDTIADLPPIIDAIEARLAGGERP